MNELRRDGISPMTVIGCLLASLHTVKLIEWAWQSGGIVPGMVDGYREANSHFGLATEREALLTNAAFFGGYLILIVGGTILRRRSRKNRAS